MFLVPRAIRSARAQVLRGVSFTKNQVLTPAQVKALPHLSALLSSGRLETVPDLHGRRGTRLHKPTVVPPVVLAAATAVPDMSVAATPTGLDAEILISGGDGPFSVDWGDASTDTVAAGRVAEHTYAGAGTYTITVTGENGDTATTNVTVA